MQRLFIRKAYTSIRENEYHHTEIEKEKASNQSLDISFHFIPSTPTQRRARETIELNYARDKALTFKPLHHLILGLL